MSARSRVILEEALPFQDELVHLVEEPLPRAIRSTIYFCVILAAAALLTAVLFKVDVVVQGPGKLTYDGPPIVLQAYERAVLRSIRVRPGDTVKAGDVLASLDPTFAQADLVALEQRNRQLSAQLRRMESELAGTDFRVTPADGEAGALQAELYLQRIAEQRSRLKAFAETIAECESGVQRIEAEHTNLKEQLTIATSVEEIQAKLLKSNTNSQLEYFAAKTTRLRLDREFRDAADRLIEKQHQLETAHAQRESFAKEWRKNLLEDLSKERSEQAQVSAALKKSSRINSLAEICAPADGIVLDVANRSVGSVLRDTEPLIILAPTESPLLCEVELSSADIGQVAVGDSVLVKVDAFPYQRYGGLSGKVRTISHESHPFGSATADLESVANKRAVHGGVHRVAIELNATRTDRLPPGRTLFPGMTASGEVHVGQRRLIQYLLDPLTRGLKESFRET